MKKLATVFTAITMGGIVAIGNAIAEEQQIEVNDNLCLSNKDNGNYREVFDTMVLHSETAGVSVETEAFFTEADKNQDVYDVNLGYTFMRISALQTGYLMFDNEAETVCRITKDTFDSVREQLQTPTQGHVLSGPN